jgi:hypothetical protein
MVIRSPDRQREQLGGICVVFLQSQVVSARISSALDRQLARLGLALFVFCAKIAALRNTSFSRANRDITAFETAARERRGAN